MTMQTVAERLVQRITDYLSSGGLFNPEQANHESVRDLLIDCREALAAYRAATPEQPAAEAWGWAIVDKNGDEVATRARLTNFFGTPNHVDAPYDDEWLVKRDREWPGLAPHRIITLYAAPPTQAAQEQPLSACPSAFEYAAQRQFAVTKEWCRGWDDCRAHLIPGIHPAQPAEQKT